MYATEGSAGCDLRAAIQAELTITPGGRALVPTGIAVAIPPGYEGQVRMRSGLAHDKGLALLNAPGTVDSDYRGVVSVILFNFGNEPFEVRRGDRIAQLVIQKTVQAEWIESDTLDETERKSGGFGSTGVNSSP